MTAWANLLQRYMMMSTANTTIHTATAILLQQFTPPAVLGGTMHCCMHTASSTAGEPMSTQQHTLAQQQISFFFPFFLMQSVPCKLMISCPAALLAARRAVKQLLQRPHKLHPTVSGRTRHCNCCLHTASCTAGVSIFNEQNDNFQRTE